ncbi:MAG: uracil-DNA glycosylase [Burkholderiaceae bacterium]|nr:uracil-DNA glycosylase [Burkholderiaceae bacterium]
MPDDAKREAGQLVAILYFTLRVNLMREAIRRKTAVYYIKRASAMSGRDAVISGQWQAALSTRALDAALTACMHVEREERDGVTIYPPRAQRFAALQTLAPAAVRVVILGQDPYHGPGQAHGFSFSVLSPCPAPRSLENIFQELKTDLGIVRTRGDLSDWAAQGALLLNTLLSVRAGTPLSHAAIGWETFTDDVVRAVSQSAPVCAFLLWGKHARSRAPLIDSKRHLRLESPHPSPLSAYRGFYGSKPFSRANAFLVKHGLEPFQWGDPQ